MPMRAAAVLGALLFIGCQSRAAGMEVMCDAPTACTDCDDVDPSQRATRLAAYIDAHVSNGEVRELVGSLAMVEPAARAELLRRAARESGIEHCAIIDAWGAP